MPHYSLRANALPRILLPLLAGLAVMAASRNAPQAAEALPVNHAYMVPADEGYGLTECFATGGECARVVADAWCESHGHAHALSLGKAEDVTGAITLVAAPGSPRPQVEPGSYIVTCGE